MTATEYLRKRNIVANNKSDLIIGFDDGSEVSLIEIMDSYHQAKLKLLGIANVVWQSEQLVCSCCEACGCEKELKICEDCYMKNIH